VLEAHLGNYCGRERKAVMVGNEPVDHESRKTERTRQGTGPRSTVTVLFISIAAAVVAGAVLLAYFRGWF
jgi:hypothetical protein